MSLTGNGASSGIPIPSTKINTRVGKKPENCRNRSVNTLWLFQGTSLRHFLRYRMLCGSALRRFPRLPNHPPNFPPTRSLHKELRTKEFSSMTAHKQKSLNQAVLRGATPPAAQCGVSVTGFGGRSPQYRK